MASGTTTRLLTKLLANSDAPVWVISPTGRLAYLSSGCEIWLGIDPQLLMDRQSIAGAHVSDDPLDRVAAALSPPPGLIQQGTSSLKVQPPAVDHSRPEPIEARFVRVGDGESAFTLAIGGNFADRHFDHELQDAVAIRQRLDVWRKQHDDSALIVTAGNSFAAQQLRRRYMLATQTRTDVLLAGPKGCGHESMALALHHRGAAGEALATVDGPLMDAELLTATIGSIIDQLSESSDDRASILIRGLDEMPIEAQARLCEFKSTFEDRLRLLALTSPHIVVSRGSDAGAPTSLNDPTSVTNPAILTMDEPTVARRIHRKLAMILGSFVIPVPALASRVDDLTMLATALLDRLRATRETTVERLNRNALDAIVNYPWPGDFDELADAIRQAASRASGQTIRAEHLPLAVRSFRSSDDPSAAKKAAIRLDEAVARFERKLIQDAIEQSDGNRAAAARRLGISRARLLRKIDGVEKRTDKE